MAKKEPFTQMSVLLDDLLTADPDIEKALREPIVRAELDKILNYFIPLTYVYSTAVSAHKVLEKIVEIQCTLA
jgi:hypothetical protein